MKEIKKFIAIILLFVMSLGLVACGDNKEQDEPKDLEKIKVVLPSGAPLMAIGDLLDNAAFDFTVVNGADPLSAALISGEYDMVIAPLNLGAKLYTLGKTAYKLDSIITSNNTYLVSRSSFTLAELNGKTILPYGQNSTPDIVLKVALESKGINAQLADYKASVAEVMQLFLANDASAEYALSAEPQVTLIKSKVQGVTVLDLVSVFEEGKIFPQACLYVKGDKDYSGHLNLIEENIKKLNIKPEEYANSVLNKHTYFEGLGVEVLKTSLPKCNIVYLKASQNKEAVNNYIEYLNNYAPAILGGKNVDDSFYN